MRLREFLYAAALFLAWTVLFLALTWPAARRELALDDAMHLRVYPAANQSLSLGEVIRLRHWQSFEVDAIWRPAAKVLWWLMGPQETERTEAAWLVMGVLAAACTSLFALLLIPWCGRWMASLLAPLPLLHPLSSDVLLPFVGHTDLLAALGMLAALICWTRNSLLWATAGGAFLLFGLLGKESVLPALLALPLLLPHWAPSPWKVRRMLALKAALAAGTAITLRLALQFLLMGQGLRATGAAGAAVSGEREVGTLEVLGRYVMALFTFQIPQTDYSFLKQPGSDGMVPWLVGLLVILAVVTAAVLSAKSPIRSRVRMRGLLFLGLLAIVMLSPYLQVVPIGALWAGRFALPPLFFIVLGVAWLYRQGGRTSRLLVPLVASAWILLGSILLWQRAEEWQSPMSLWSAEVRRVETHAFAWKNLGVILDREQAGGEGLAMVVQSTILWPTFAEGWLARGKMEAHAGMLQNAEHSLRRAMELLPPPQAEIDLVRVLARQGRFQEAHALLEEVAPAAGEMEEDVGILRQALLRDMQREKESSAEESPSE